MVTGFPDESIALLRSPFHIASVGSAWPFSSALFRLLWLFLNPSKAANQKLLLRPSYTRGI